MRLREVFQPLEQQAVVGLQGQGERSELLDVGRSLEVSRTASPGPEAHGLAN
jgi:hypothetical protein